MNTRKMKEGAWIMVCPKCGGTNATIQLSSDVHTKTHGWLYWVLFGWWWFLIKFFLLFGWLTFFLPSRKKIVTTQVKYGLCHDCGYDWKLDVESGARSA